MHVKHVIEKAMKMIKCFCDCGLKFSKPITKKEISNWVVGSIRNND
jgi:hypothetical protein